MISFHTIGKMKDKPETKTYGDTTILTFSFETEHKYKGDTVVDVLSLTAFGKTGQEILDGYSPGRWAFIEGRRESRAREKDGKTYINWNEIVDRVVFIDAKLEAKKEEPKPDYSLPFDL